MLTSSANSPPPVEIPAPPAPPPAGGHSQRVAKLAAQLGAHMRTFANDPVRANHPLTILPSHIEELDGRNWLTTAFVDILLQKAFSKETISDDLLIGSGLIATWLKAQLSANNNNHYYAHLGQKRYRLLAVNCGLAHFWVVDIAFDLTNNDEPFEYVRVYDSIRSHAGPLRRVKPKHTSAINLLKDFQKFLVRCCLPPPTTNTTVTTPKKGLLLLQTDPDYILKNAVLSECPQQQNSWDCGLFSLALLFHLANDINIDKDTFSQKEVSTFRLRLHQRLSAPSVTVTRRGVRQESVSFLNAHFLFSFFPSLAQAGDMTAVPSLVLIPSEQQRGSRKNTNQIGVVREDKKEDKDVTDDYTKEIADVREGKKEDKDVTEDLIDGMDFTDEHGEEDNDVDMQHDDIYVYNHKEKDKEEHDEQEVHPSRSTTNTLASSLPPGVDPVFLRLFGVLESVEGGNIRGRIGVCT